MTIWLAVIAGSALGFVFKRGDFCFHSTWRRLFDEQPDGSLAATYAVLLVVSIPIVQLLIWTDVINPWIAPFAPLAAVVGGLVFGAGMVVAQTCVSGMFYKLGAGMLGMVVAIAAWAVGDLLVWRGPLSSVRTSLNERVVDATDANGNVQPATVETLFGPIGIVLLAVALIGAVVVMRRTGLLRSERRIDVAANRVSLGIATAAVIVIAWLLVTWHGGDYSYGTAGVPNQLASELLDDGGGSMWIPLGLATVTVGALVASLLDRTLWVRGEQAKRYAQLAGGGLIMGIGAAIAGGCNLGHGMVGVSLLSVGSIVTTLSIIAGVFVASRVARLL